MKITTKEQVQRYLSQPNGPEKLLENGSDTFDLCYELFLEDFAPASAYFCRAARARALRERLESRLGPDHGPLLKALGSSSPKMRKNAARLCGMLGREEDAHSVIQALAAEKTRFVRPSMLLALGALGGREAEEALKRYQVQPPASSDEQSHADQELRALYTALRKFLSIDKHTFTGLTEPCNIELRAPDKLAGCLAGELLELGFTPESVGRDYVRLRTQDLEGLYGARCFSEALIEIARSVSAHPKGIAVTARGFLEKLARDCHQGEPPMGYRIEIQGAGVDRAILVDELVKHIDCSALVNSPGSYEIELRVELRQNGSAGLYAKLHSFEDPRFAYRKASVPASIHPVTAAAILRYADAYLRPGAAVLDPCCGSGTLLIERHKLCPCSHLTGVDVNPRSLELASQNIEAAELTAQLISKDCLRFDAALPYDEVVANLPFGNRVGSHEGNRRLYAGLLDKLPKWLRRGGIAVLYTMEYTMLKKLIRERPNLRLMGETRTQAGGLMPAIFIVKVE